MDLVSFFRRSLFVAVASSIFLNGSLASCVPAAGSACLACHPKQVETYSRSAMARALTRCVEEPEGTFEHLYSKTTFRVYSDPAGPKQRLTRNGEVAEQPIAYVIGSGNHAFGYLVRVGDHLFQSPLCYYTQSRSWDIAPGYEFDPHPDFSRPVPLACLLCHSGKPEALNGTLNRYRDTVFSAEGISCERCHGPATEHLRKPFAGSIVNPAKLAGPRRDSVCEQCHLAGEIRITNPGKTLADYVPGESLEDTFTIYVRAQASRGTIKVVSHVEQLALSSCARSSGGRLWCGTCHNPHQTIAHPVEYFRGRCLSCHAATLDKAHAAEGRNCVACHMQQKPTSDGGHTIFTDHRIARRPEVPDNRETDFNLKAWREPQPEFRDRNFGLALADYAIQKQSAPQMVEAFRLLYRVEKRFSKDPAVLTTLASLLFIAGDLQEAESRYRQAVALRGDFALYQMDLAATLLKEQKKPEARDYLERALELDPLLESAVQMLSRLYQESGDQEKASALLNRYRLAMGYKH